MDQKQASKLLSNLVEALAEIEHQRWAHWQKYLHSRCEQQSDGSMLIPAELVKKWEVQISTPYRELSEQEKQSDREQVHKYLPVIAEALVNNVE